MRIDGQRPHLLFILVDEQRYPPLYEQEPLAAFRAARMPTQARMRARGLTFHRHYTAATACSPSRTTLFTGHLPSYHRVDQTDGLAKSASDPAMFWLEPDTVPTLGDYLRTGGYRTFYRGKWHISHADLLYPATHDPIPSSDEKGQAIPDHVREYEQADRLEPYGFSGWIGPEPHGPDRSNAGIVRDPGFADQAVALLDRLEAEYTKSPDLPPFALVVSFVNPHDIVYFALPWRAWGFPFADDGVPDIPASPTRDESLKTKPRCHRDFIDKYPRMLLPQPDVQLYRRFYHALQARVDLEVGRVYQRLERSPLFERTLVVFSSDHGEALGAHGGFHQKWHNAYDETIRVPLIVSNPKLFPQPRETQMLSSHLDLLPTLLSVAEVQPEAATQALSSTHRLARMPVGRDLSPLLEGKPLAEAPLYFMTDDEISEGLEQVGPTRRKYDAVIQPNHVESVISRLSTSAGEKLYKLNRYFDPGTDRLGRAVAGTRAADELELYDLDGDPLEERNLAHPKYETPEGNAARSRLEALLTAQRTAKRLSRPAAE